MSQSTQRLGSVVILAMFSGIGRCWAIGHETMKPAWPYQTDPNNFTFAIKSARRMKHIHIWKSCVKIERYHQLDAWFGHLIQLILSFVADRLQIWCLQQQVVLFVLHGVALLLVLFARWDTKKSWRWCQCQGRDAAGWLIKNVQKTFFALCLRCFCFPCVNKVNCIEYFTEQEVILRWQRKWNQSQNKSSTTALLKGKGESAEWTSTEVTAWNGSFPWNSLSLSFPPSLSTGFCHLQQHQPRPNCPSGSQELNSKLQVRFHNQNENVILPKMTLVFSQVQAASVKGCHKTW